MLDILRSLPWLQPGARASRVVVTAALLSATAGCGALPSDPAPLDEVAAIAIGDPLLSSGNGRPAGGGPDLIDPSGAELEVGHSLQLTALNAAGEPIEVSWSSSDPSVASISAGGLVSGVGAGTAMVTAKSRRDRATAQISVIGAAAQPVDAQATCAEIAHLRRVDVTDGSQLGSALADARPGDLIVLAPGTYTGRWTIRASGTATDPISLCGSRDAVLSDTRYDGGVVLRLSGASHWLLRGFTVRTALWGIRLEGSSYNHLHDLLVHDIGQEGVAIKSNSSYNVVQGLRVRDTGRRGWDYQQWGEGIYVGSWSGHWTDGQPDRSDHNQIIDSHFGPYVTAEHIDVKEGTTGTIIRGNRFDGRGLDNPGDRVDAWVLVQGNEGVIENNTGTISKTHGFRVWPGHDGNWGQRNVFRGNSVDVRADGYGFIVQGRDNVIRCDNAVTNAGSGFANVACSS